MIWLSFPALGLVVYAFIYNLRTHIVTVARMDDHYVWLRGAGEDYLERLPEWPGLPSHAH